MRSDNLYGTLLVIALLPACFGNDGKENSYTSSEDAAMVVVYLVLLVVVMAMVQIVWCCSKFFCPNSCCYANPGDVEDLTTQQRLPAHQLQTLNEELLLAFES